MKKFTFKGVLDGFRSQVQPQMVKPDQEIQETLRPEHFQLRKVSLSISVYLISCNLKQFLLMLYVCHAMCFDNNNSMWHHLFTMWLFDKIHVRFILCNVRAINRVHLNVIRKCNCNKLHSEFKLYMIYSNSMRIICYLETKSLSLIIISLNNKFIVVFFLEICTNFSDLFGQCVSSSNVSKLINFVRFQAKVRKFKLKVSNKSSSSNIHKLRAIIKWFQNYHQ